MRPWEWIRRGGTLLLLASLGALAQEPLRAGWLAAPASLAVLLPLYGFPFLAGWSELAYGYSPASPKPWATFIARTLAFMANLWLLTWCFVWLALLTRGGGDAEMMVKHMAYLHLFGVGFTMAGTVLAFRQTGAARTQQFLVAVGWACAYVLFIQWAFVEPGVTLLPVGSLGGLLWMTASWRLQKAAVGGPRSAVSKKTSNE